MISQHCSQLPLRNASSQIETSSRKGKLAALEMFVVCWLLGIYMHSVPATTMIQSNNAWEASNVHMLMTFSNRSIEWLAERFEMFTQYKRRLGRHFLDSETTSPTISWFCFFSRPKTIGWMTMASSSDDSALTAASVGLIAARSTVEGHSLSLHYCCGVVLF